jgi:hypothetical protein
VLGSVLASSGRARPVEALEIREVPGVYVRDLLPVGKRQRELDSLFV